MFTRPVPHTRLDASLSKFIPRPVPFPLPPAAPFVPALAALALASATYRENSVTCSGVNESGPGTKWKSGNSSAPVEGGG